MTGGTMRDDDTVDVEKLASIVQENIERNEYYETLLTNLDAAVHGINVVEGDKATPEVWEKSMREYLEPEPLTTGQKILTGFWIRKGWHTLTKVLPAAAVIASPFVYNAVQEHRAEQALVRAEIDVESRAEHAFAQYLSQEGHTRNLVENPVLDRLPGNLRSSVESNISLSNSHGENTRAILSQLVDDRGQSTNIINRENMNDKQLVVEDVLVEIASRARVIEAANGIVDQQILYETAVSEFTEVRNRIDASNFSPQYMSRINTAARLGEAHSRQRDIGGINDATRALRNVENERNNYEAAAIRGERIIAQTDALQCSDEQLTQFNSARGRFERAKLSSNLDRMQAATNDMDYISFVLGNEYIVRGVGVVEITQNSNRSVKDWYVRAQAEQQGNVIRLKWQDNDMPDDTLELTPQWGELITKQLYDDMSIERRIPPDNDILGAKGICEMEPTYDWHLTVNGNPFSMTESRARITPHNPDGNLNTSTVEGRLNWRTGKSTR